LSPAGWFRSDATDRPFYHAADAGFPLLALSEYLVIARPVDAPPVSRRDRPRPRRQLALNAAVANPFDYPARAFQLYRDGKRGTEVLTGFFMPHANETGYWWQGEDARLASLAVRRRSAAGGGAVRNGVWRQWAPGRPCAALARLDPGRNPFDVCMLYGFGGHNPDYSEEFGDQPGRRNCQWHHGRRGEPLRAAASAFAPGRTMRTGAGMSSGCRIRPGCC